MSSAFADKLKEIRISKNLSQQQLADMLYVDRTSVAHWENGRRIPSPTLLVNLANALEEDVSVLVNNFDKPELSVIIVDDEAIQLIGSKAVISEVLPNADIKTFSKISMALNYARENRVSIAFLDIEIGRNSGLDLCRDLLEIYPLTNIIFLTAYPDYAIEAWNTEASGFLVKPLHAKDVSKQLKKLRHPIGGLL